MGGRLHHQRQKQKRKRKTKRRKVSLPDSSAVAKRRKRQRQPAQRSQRKRKKAVSGCLRQEEEGFFDRLFGRLFGGKEKKEGVAKKKKKGKGLFGFRFGRLSHRRVSP